MAISIEDLLSRADGPQLASLMPDGTTRLLNAIDPKLIYPRNLLRILLKLRSPADLLLERGCRALVIDLLPVEQAKLLALLFPGYGADDPFEFLKSIAFASKSQQSTLFGFLGIGRLAEQAEEIGPSDTRVEPEYPLFDHQIAALCELRLKLAVEPFRALLHMPTGSGKTRTAMNAVVDHLRNRQRAVVVWLAHSEELCQQAANEFEKAWRVLGNRSLRVARYWGKYNSDLTDLSDGVVFAGLAKSFSRLRSDDKHFRALSGRSPFVVMDEAHQAIAPTYKLILDLLVRPQTGAKLLGLSATPGRTWNDPEKDELLSDFFARKKVTLRVPGYENPVKFLIDEGYLATPLFRRITVDTRLELTAAEKVKISETFDLPVSVLERLGRHEGRNLQVIFEIERLARSHKRIIVFAASVEQSDLLSAVLSARGHLASSVSSRCTPLQRQLAIESYLNDSEECHILCNFGVLTTGFDAPKTSAALIARPTLSLVLYSQMIGRAMRGKKAGGNLEAEIVTVVDPSLPGFDSIESAFSNWEDVWIKN